MSLTPAEQAALDDITNAAPHGDPGPANPEADYYRRMLRRMFLIEARERRGEARTNLIVGIAYLAMAVALAVTLPLAKPEHPLVSLGIALFLILMIVGNGILRRANQARAYVAQRAADSLEREAAR